MIVQLVTSRKVADTVEDLHSDIDRLRCNNDANHSVSTHVDWTLQLKRDEERSVVAFRRTFAGCELSISGLGTEAEGGAESISLLQHEIDQYGSVYSHEKLRLLSDCLAKVVQLSGPEASLSKLLPWFIPHHEIHDFGESVNAGALTHPGMWLRSNVMMRRCNMEHTTFVEEVQRWHPLSHPNVVKMFGACDLHRRYEMIPENVVSTNLWTFLTEGSNHHLIWQALLEVALGIKYLHERGTILGIVQCESIWIGADGLAKILVTFPTTSDEKTEIRNARWTSPELIQGDTGTKASGVYSFGMCIAEAATGTLL